MAARRAGFAAEAARLGLTAELPGGAPGAAGPGGGRDGGGALPAGASAGPGVPQLRALLQGPDRPTAVAAGSDLAALAVYEAVRAEGLVVGRDVAVVGFDTPLCRHLHPALSSVRLPLRAIAAGLVGLLLTQIRGETVRGRGWSCRPSWWCAPVRADRTGTPVSGTPGRVRPRPVAGHVRRTPRRWGGDRPGCLGRPAGPGRAGGVRPRRGRR
ncbi:substrate-binding domain-containing protein [Kitasatospora aburaviensis]